MAELKPCEGVTINKCKCGRYPTLFDNSNLVKINPVWWIECKVCKIKGKNAQNFCQAIDAWNKTMRELKAKRKSTRRHTRKPKIIGGGR